MIDEQHVFNNRYRLDNKLGEGGMATVYCGTDTLLRRRVAIKVLRPHYASDEEFVRRFYQEAESAARLSHPNIVNTYDVGREGDTYYIVMELVDGPSLAEIIAADGKLPEPVAIDYAAQICNGLAYAHRQGLLHRDIKPANILITKDDVVKLSDFGIARAMSQQTMAMTRPGLVMGSVYYLSPEQAQGLELHETSDLYSVGVLLYQMLTGKLPYTGESPVTVALKHVSDPVPSIDPQETGVSPALASIVNRLLQKQPAHRFQSASEVASALREARERPSVAAYGQGDDSETQTFAAIPPPPRPSRMPDTRTAIVDEDESTRPRSMGPIFVLLVIAAIIAGAAGYFATRPIGEPRIAVQNYVGMTDADAQQAILNAGLNYKITRGPSTAVPANRVAHQDPTPGTQLAKGAIVQLDLSTGMPSVGLKDFTGYTVDDAQKDLAQEKFRVKVTGKFDRSAKGTVLSQSPGPGSTVREGSAVTLIVSNGPEPIKMPNLVGLTTDKANAIAARDGFTINISEKSAMANIPPNVIASQDVTPGTSVPADHSVTVNVVVSTGGGLAQIPNVLNADYATAQQQLQSAGFQVNTEYMIKLSSADNGTIVDESPSAGTMAEKGTSVKITLSVPGEVPDTDGLTLDAAKALLVKNGYQVGNLVPTQEGADGNVVRTEPEAGTSLRPGESVNIYYNSPSAQPQPGSTSRRRT
ncbi:MAG TPA: Stk1 family PASTA domain-containing Ser/Thr kinase [Candidatus Baltobacteraceae bacterium]|nr:Stk1 family PASTA domain-containing Ser/Thr kinase [Candidatus Baltobacteraceae bacterium]